MNIVQATGEVRMGTLVDYITFDYADPQRVAAFMG
jgi:hypothetical protein